MSVASACGASGRREARQPAAFLTRESLTRVSGETESRRPTIPVARIHSAERQLHDHVGLQLPNRHRRLSTHAVHQRIVFVVLGPRAGLRDQSRNFPGGRGYQRSVAALSRPPPTKKQPRSLPRISSLSLPGPGRLVVRSVVFGAGSISAAVCSCVVPRAFAFHHNRPRRGFAGQPRPPRSCCRDLWQPSAASPSMKSSSQSRSDWI